MPKPITCLSSREVYSSPLVSVHHDAVRSTDNVEQSYTAIRFKVCGVTVLPIDAEGRTRLVGQYRYVADRHTWELVRGAGSLADHLGAAQRELSEETGLTARNWLPLFDLMASPGLSDEISPCFVAWDLHQGPQHTDPIEDLRVRSVTFTEAVDLVLRGEIVDAPSCTTILAVQVRAARGDLPEDLLDVLRFRNV